MDNNFINLMVMQSGLVGFFGLLLFVARQKMRKTFWYAKKRIQKVHRCLPTVFTARETEFNYLNPKSR
jgi:hypothetical protein